MRAVGTLPLLEADVRHRPDPSETERPRRIAVCGGLYANPYALSAFVTDAHRRGCDQLYCLGDLGGFGAENDALWPILQAADITCVAGNYDVAIARGDPDCGCGYRDPTDNEYAQLTKTIPAPASPPGWAASRPSAENASVAAIST